MTRLFTYDARIIDAISLLGQVSTQQLDRLVFYNASPASKGRQCRDVLQRLHESGEIGRLKRSVGGAGSEGYTFVPARSDRDPMRVDPHALDISELYVRLKQAEREGLCEVELFEVEDFIQRTRTRYDARAIIATDRRRDWYIEIDRGTMRRPQITSKMQAYSRSARAAVAAEQKGYPKILYVVTSEPHGKVRERAKLLADVAADRRMPGLFEVCTLDQAIQVLTGGPNA